MMKSIVYVHPAFVIDRVDERVFGGFLEHLGRAVYQGVFDPDSAQADEQGFRRDVLGALARLRLTAMRYPGGNFASGYHWLDGVGPREKRPKRRDLAWQSLEPNWFGTNEFIQLCRKLGWIPMITVNLGTGTPEEACQWLEYCNGAPGTYWADLRVEHGFRDPHDVRLWCLGNEMDGPWQIGHVPAEHYAIRAQQTARLMKMMDPRVELVVCGSCTVDLPTYLEWDRKVLEYCRDDVDYISLHRYVGNRENDTPEFLACTRSVDEQIEAMNAMCLAVHRMKRTRKRVYLSFDEWNVWYRATGEAHWDGKGRFAPPLLEEVYNLEDALVVAGFLNSFIRHADCVKIANLAQIVNVIAPIMTRGDRMVLQTIFYPIEMFSRRREGMALRLAVEGPEYQTKRYGKVTYLDVSAILNGQRLHAFLVNRSLDTAMEVELRLAEAKARRLVDGEIVTGTDPKQANTFEQPEQVVSQAFQEVVVNGSTVRVKLPALSVAAMTVELEI